MDIGEIRRLAATGIAAFPPAQLTEASAWLNDYAIASGKAAYSALARVLDDIADTFAAQSEQMLEESVERIDALLAEAIPEILSCTDQAEAAGRVRRLHEGVVEELRAEYRGTYPSASD